MDGAPGPKNPSRIPRVRGSRPVGSRSLGTRLGQVGGLQGLGLGPWDHWAQGHSDPVARRVPGAWELGVKVPTWKHLAQAAARGLGHRGPLGGGRQGLGERGGDHREQAEGVEHLYVRGRRCLHATRNPNVSSDIRLRWRAEAGRRTPGAEELGGRRPAGHGLNRPDGQVRALGLVKLDGPHPLIHQVCTRASASMAVRSTFRSGRGAAAAAPTE